MNKSACENNPPLAAATPPRFGVETFFAPLINVANYNAMFYIIALPRQRRVRSAIPGGRRVWMAVFRGYCRLVFGINSASPAWSLRDNVYVILSL